MMDCEILTNRPSGRGRSVAATVPVRVQRYIHRAGLGWCVSLTLYEPWGPPRCPVYGYWGTRPVAHRAVRGVYPDADISMESCPLS